MGFFKIEKLGIDSRNLRESRDGDPSYGLGVKWRFGGDSTMRTSSPVEEIQEKAKEASAQGEQFEISGEMLNKDILSRMNIEELRTLAGHLGIGKISRASKEELIGAILQRKS